jgi:hypothetical protein
MKKLSSLIILAVFFAVIGCKKDTKEPQQPKRTPPTFAEKTERNMKKWLDDILANPEAFQLRRKKVIYDTDSLCIINIEGIAENQFGGHAKFSCQYFNIVTGSMTWEHWEKNEDYEYQRLNTGNPLVFLAMQDLHRKNDPEVAQAMKDTSEAGQIYADAYVLVAGRGIAPGDNTRVIMSDTDKEVVLPNLINDILK